MNEKTGRMVKIAQSLRKKIEQEQRTNPRTNTNILLSHEQSPRLNWSRHQQQQPKLNTYLSRTDKQTF